MTDDLKASFEQLMRDYPSGMKVNSLLSAKNFSVKSDYMLVGNGAAELIKALMENSRGKTVCAIVKLKSRIDAHKATITEDFQVMKDVVLAKRRQEVLHQWVVDKIKDTYVRMNPRYEGCDFEYEGWIK